MPDAGKVAVVETGSEGALRKESLCKGDWAEPKGVEFHMGPQACEFNLDTCQVSGAMFPA